MRKGISTVEQVSYPAFFSSLSVNIFKKLISLPGVLLLTAAVYSFTLGNGFINWDDTLYITENVLIRDLSVAGILKIFSTLHFNGFLPVTQLSLAIDFFFWKDNPMGYHLTNLLLHLANVTIAYFLAIQLTGRGRAALITCLLFAIHPMRVESVAWAAERKDVLYAFFYLFSLFTYVKYLKSNFKFRFYILSFLFFALSVFSKWSAFPLPLILLLIDHLFGRKIGMRAILEKLPLIIIPAISIYIHFSKGTVIAEHFTFLNRLLLGSYSLALYVIKFFFPFNLSAIYPYPKLSDGLLPPEYYFSFFAVLIAGWIVYVMARKHVPERNFILFCITFFIINLGMVLHVLSPIGGVVVAADRYTYISYFGLFLLAGKYAGNFYERNRQNTVKNIPIVVLASVVVLFSFLTFQRTRVWKNSTIFFNEVLRSDTTIALAWNNLGLSEADEGKQQQAIVHYTKAIELKPDFSVAYNNRGLAYDATANFKKAIEDFNYAISIKNYDATLYFNRGLTYYHMQDYESAINDLSTAVNINPDEAQYYIKRGAIKNDMKNYSGALEDFIEAVRLVPQNAEAFNYLGLSYNYLGRIELALQAYDRAVVLSPDYSSAYNNRGWVKFSINDKEGAMNDFSKSIELDSLYSYPYHNRGLLYYDLNMPDKACEDWQSASKLGYKNSQELIRKYCSIK